MWVNAILAAVLVIGMAAAYWWLSRRRKELLGEDGKLPSVRAERDDYLPPPRLTRDSLVNRPQAFDPHAWDDSPDSESGTEPEAPPARPEPEDELPAYFDREFLERRQRKPEPDKQEPPE